LGKGYFLLLTKGKICGILKELSFIIIKDNQMKSLISAAIFFAVSVSTTLPVFAAPWVGTPRVDDYTEIVKSSNDQNLGVRRQVSGVYLRSGNIQTESGQKYYGELQLVVAIPKCSSYYLRPQFIISYSDIANQTQFKKKLGLNPGDISLKKRADGLYEGYLTLRYNSPRSDTATRAMQGLVIKYNSASCTTY
jgi:hypothetical protein